MKQPLPPKKKTNKQTKKREKTKKKRKRGTFLQKLSYYLKLSASGVKRKQKLDFCDHAH